MNRAPIAERRSGTPAESAEVPPASVWAYRIAQTRNIAAADVALALVASAIFLASAFYLLLELDQGGDLAGSTPSSAGGFSITAHQLEVALTASLCLVFWGVATFVVLFVRPRDVRWALLSATAYDTALWLAAGTASGLESHGASVVFHAALWIFLPLCVHLHLVLPAPMFHGATHRACLIALYLGALVGAGFDLGDQLPKPIIVVPIGLAILLSLGLLIAGLKRPQPPVIRFARRGMTFGLVFGLGPTLAAALLVWLPETSILWPDPMGLRVTLLMAVPIWPIAYVFTLAQRPTAFEIRANRMLGLYGYVLVCISIGVIALGVGQSTGWLEASPASFALVSGLLFALVAPELRRHFQRFADRLLAGLETPPEQLVASFAERLPTIPDPETLGEVLARDILPALLVRQSALYTFCDSGPTAIYEDAVPRPPTDSTLRQLQTGGARRLRSTDPRPDGFDWVRVVLPLAHEDRPLGVWLFGRRDPDDLYTRRDIQLLDQLASQAVALLHTQVETREKERLREMLAHSRKMEAVGRLSAAVAHDFNNLLAIIELNSGFLVQRIDTPELQRYVEGIIGAAERASTLTRELLTFSRQRVVRPRRMNLNRLLCRIEPLIESSVGDHIEMVLSLDPLLPAIEADPGRLEQVILNLAVNARDAMPNGGRLSFETEVAAGSAVDGAAGVGQSQHAVMRVRDTGEGIPDDVLSQIFEPFFTTKERGRGTGLGLAITYGVMRQSGGRVDVASQEGEGTVFTLHLPLATQASARVESSVTVPAPPPKGQGTILLVEDEDFLRDALREALTDDGFTVISAPDGVVALDLLKHSRRPIDLVLTDVVMPRLGGPELVTRALALQPTLRALYISGYDDGLIDAATPESTPVLPKPFSGETLCRRVREVLETPLIVQPSTTEKGLKSTLRSDSIG